MTKHKHFKQLVRARMSKTGESYSSARRHILNDSVGQLPRPSHGPHFAGMIPATTALRIALTNAGMLDPRTKRPFTEATLFGIAGGIGFCICAFVYEKEDHATFYITGRHLVIDDQVYLRAVAKRLGILPIVQETSSEKKGALLLEKMLAEHGPCIAWVDAASLPHRAMPECFRGGGYHIVTVYSVEGDAALIGDMTDEPVSIRMNDLSQARSRIKKFKNRLMHLPPGRKEVDVASAMGDGLRACCDGLDGEGGVPGYTANFSLAALHRWGSQLDDSEMKDCWEKRFTPGKRMWQGLLGIHDFIEHHGTGGGLCRPIFAACLSENADLLGGSQWRSLANRYRELGQQWTELADVALPDKVPLFRIAKKLLTRKAELINSGGSEDEVRAIWRELDQLAAQAAEKFPLSAADASELRQSLKKHVVTLYDDEVAAQKELGRLVQ